MLASIAGWAITSTTGGVHATGSLHKVAATNGIGRAIDVADRRGPSSNSAWLLAINQAVLHILPLSMIAELIYGGDYNVCVKNGQIVDGHAVFGATVMAAHMNHVHLAVISGFAYNGEASMPDDPNLPNLPDIMGFYPVINTTTGESTGYYILAKDGELHAFGPGAKFYGRSEVPPG